MIINKKTHRKKGFLTLAIAVLSGIAILSSGFAAWIISGGDTKNIEGNIQVETVDDQRHLIKVVSIDGNSGNTTSASIVYGPNVTEGSSLINSSNPWLKISDWQEEKLSFTVKIKVSNLPKPKISKISATFKETTNPSKYTSAATINNKTVVGAIPTPSIAYDGESTTSIENEMTYYPYKLTVTFTWGSYFGNKNPWESSSITDNSSISEFISALQAVYAVNEATFKLTISTTA